MFLQGLVICLLCSLGFRVRGGLFERQWRRLPLNKWWFAAIFAGCATYLYGGDLNYYLVMLIAARLCTQLAGWGEFVGCVLGIGKPDPNRKDLPKVDDILDNMRWDKHTVKVWKWNITVPAFNLLDYPMLFGWLGLSIRGLYLSFIIGLALQSIPFMLSGLAMGTIYWLCGRLVANTKVDDGKGGWNISEWLFGAYLGLMLVLS